MILSSSQSLFTSSLQSLSYSRENQVITWQTEAACKYVFQHCRKSPNELRTCSLRLIWRWRLLAGMSDKQTEAPMHVDRRSDSTLRFSLEIDKSYFISLRKGRETTGAWFRGLWLGRLEKARREKWWEYNSRWFYHFSRPGKASPQATPFTEQTPRSGLYFSLIYNQWPLPKP